MQPQPITQPWIVVHQPEGKDHIETVLFGPNDANPAHFAMAAADIIKHIGLAFNIQQVEVIDQVMRELNNPTSKAKRVTND